MKTSMACVSSIVSILFFVGGQVSAAQPQYPERPIRVIVPFSPGGGADTIARAVGQKLFEVFDQPIVVDNRVGAGGNIGTAIVANTSPDGYNLLLGYVGNLAIGPALHRKLPFDPLRDFAAITQLASAPNVLVVYPSVPVRTFNEFIEYVKARPQQINFASAVVGSPGHLAGEYLKHTAGLQMAHIPYKGAAQAVIDLLGGQVHAMFGVSTVMPHVKTGKLRALATTGLQRFSLLPDVPTIAESGFPGFEATAWYGFLAASGTPKAIVSRLHDETARALQTSFVTSKLKPLGFELVGSTPDAFAMYIRAETKKWGEIVKSAGIKAD